MMDKPAILGGPRAISGVIAPYNSLAHGEIAWASEQAGTGPLSGFLAGADEGGRLVQLLEGDWCKFFGCEFAVSVNSATSGLLVACMAINLRGGEVIVSPYTMSATAAAPAFMGADIVYADIDPLTFCLDPDDVARKITGSTRAVIATNLFGHPARLHQLRKLCDDAKIWLIEDNAQAPMATEDSRYTGTIGHIGVFSLNVHKHFQCGEGGICTTDDPHLARAMKAARNHGEHTGLRVGLNLRMTEYSAAIAIAQLKQALVLISSRRYIALQLSHGIGKIPGITVPVTRLNCNHVYYLWPYLVDERLAGIPRGIFAKALEHEGFPVSVGYVEPLYKMRGAMFADANADCPVTEECYGKTLCIYENCAYDPTESQINEIVAAFTKVAESAEEIKARWRVE